MKIKGIAASDGISIAKVYKLESAKLNVVKDLVNNTNEELTKLEEALEKSINEIQMIRDKTVSKASIEPSPNKLPTDSSCK